MAVLIAASSRAGDFGVGPGGKELLGDELAGVAEKFDDVVDAVVRGILVRRCTWIRGVDDRRKLAGSLLS